MPTTAAMLNQKLAYSAPGNFVLLAFFCNQALNFPAAFLRRILLPNPSLCFPNDPFHELPTTQYPLI